MSGFPNTSINDSVVDTTRGTASRVVGSCILIFLDLAALVGNSLVCLAFYRKPSLRTVTNYFVLSLALTDMSIAVLVIPLNISGSVANKWIAGEFGCLLSYACGIALLGNISVNADATSRQQILACNKTNLVFWNLLKEKCCINCCVCVDCNNSPRPLLFFQLQ